MDEFISSIKNVGFAIAPVRLDGTTVGALIQEIDSLTSVESIKQKAQKTYAMRNLFDLAPLVNAVSICDPMRSLVEPLLGRAARAVRALLFDKIREANWTVAWHQDMTIAVKRMLDAEGFSGWSVKSGVVHVQPPVAILEQMLTLRIHLDDAGEDNGPLRVLAGSHKRGRLDADQLRELVKEVPPVSLPARAGEVVALRPLVVHSSTAPSQPSHRRVLHIEFASGELPAGLEWRWSIRPSALKVGQGHCMKEAS